MKSQALFFALLLSVAGTQVLHAQCCDFSIAQQPDPGGATFGVSLGDIDGDADRDAVAVYAYNGFHVYLNDGDGNFSFGQAYAADDDYFGIDLVDLDGDEDLDIVAAAFYSSQNTRIFLNNGSGSFAPSQSLNTNIGIRNLAIGDIDSDLDPDLFIPASSGAGGQVWKNNGYGYFTNVQTLTGAIGEDAALGDLDGDGDLDAWVARNSSGAGNTVWMNNGEGQFSDSGQSLGLNSSQSVALGDLDGDGDLDAAEANWGIQQIWINDGTGVFSEGNTLDNNNYAKSVKLADNDLDGDLDVFLSWYGEGSQVWVNDGLANFTLCYTSPDLYAHDMAVGDIDSDGLTDMYVGYFSNTDGDFVLLNKTSVALIFPDGPLHFCEGGSVTLSANEGVTYLWSTGEETPSILVTESGEYWVQVIDPFDCPSQSALTTVTVHPLPVVTYVELNNPVFNNTPSFPLTPGVPAGGIYSGPGVTGNTFDPATVGVGSHEITYSFTDNFGCSGSDTSVIVVNQSTGTAEAGEGNGVLVFPNPASDYLTINAKNAFAGVEYRILDSFGREVMSGILSGENTRLDTRGLPSGMYFLEIKEVYGMVRWVK